MGSEFVLHVPDEYDYRYSSFDKRDIIVEGVLRAYSFSNKGQLMPFYYIVTVLIDNKNEKFLIRMKFLLKNIRPPKAIRKKIYQKCPPCNLL